MAIEENVTAAGVVTESDEILDSSLRPTHLGEYFGQHDIKNSLRIIIEAARQREEPVDHLLLYGPPGLGKTTLAKIIGAELDAPVRITSGPAIERTGDLASILTNIEDNGILFIDEIHRLNKVVQEMLYPAMEERAIDIIVGKGPSARTLRLELPNFTVVGATTRMGLINAPMRDRFGAIFRLDFYEEESLQQILQRSAQLLEIEMSMEAAYELAKRSRGTPRIANRLLKRVRDFAEVEGDGVITTQVIEEACEILKVDHDGLDFLDQKYLNKLLDSFDGGPAGLETIAASLSEDSGTLEDIIEPFLLQRGFIKKTPRGRVATQRAYEKTNTSI